MNETIQNLAKAFIGESQARNRYSFYSKIAKKEGYEQIADIFLITADNEREHAKWLFRMINQLKENLSEDIDELNVDGTVPLTLDNTLKNLEAAISGERYERETMYPEFAATAEREGFYDIATRLRAIGKAEEHHEERYTKLLKEIEGETVFKKVGKVQWVCKKCGYVHEGETPPTSCPSCDHPRNYFEMMCEQY
ncbi:MAG: rubrerythrin family protein [Candidatus Heimdallarchaeota archaeon]|nr:MAG: rubrerythrin family protein [Candidatus Heimdallarchaeota archaeon]